LRGRYGGKNCHRSPVELLVDGDFSNKYLVSWSEPMSKRGWKEPRDFAEAGAFALAFYLTTSLTEYQVVEQAPIGKGGFDYFLGYKEDYPKYDPDNFMNARLEISGTSQGVKALARRVQKNSNRSNNLMDGTFQLILPLQILANRLLT